MPSSRPTDFNDLHVLAGLDAVRAQILAVLDGGTVPPAPPVDESAPVGDVPPVVITRPTLDQCLERFALIVPEGKLWDGYQKKIFNKAAFKSWVGSETAQGWFDAENKRYTSMDSVKPLLAKSQLKTVDGLSKALQRYVYLNPSSEAWDRAENRVVALKDLKYAIADCFEIWIKHPDRREIPVQNLIFDPTQRVSGGDVEFINKFKGLPLEPEPVGADLAGCANLIELMRVLVNNDDECFLWLRKWLAYPLVHLGAKMTTAVLMHSCVHGSGKSLFFDGVMRQIYGEYAGVFTQVEIESQYNDWISEKLFAVFEEILPRAQKQSHVGTLKQMITGKRFRVNKKFLSGWEEANHMNGVFLSNEFQPLYVEPSDRRFFVVWPEEKLLARLKSGVDAELNGGGAAKFYQWLLDTDLTGFSEYTEPPVTEAKRRIIDFGRPAWEVFYLQWKAGELDYPYCSCLVSQLYRAHKRWCGQTGEHAIGQNKFAAFIAGFERRRPDMHYQQGSTTKTRHGSMFVIHECPTGKTQQEWLGSCVDEFERCLSVYERDEK